MTYPLREDLTTGRTIAVTEDERRLLLRLLDAKWSDLNSDDKTPGTLTYLQDLETLQGKLK